MIGFLELLIFVIVITTCVVLLVKKKYDLLLFGLGFALIIAGLFMFFQIPEKNEFTQIVSMFDKNYAQKVGVMKAFSYSSLIVGGVLLSVGFIRQIKKK